MGIGQQYEGNKRKNNIISPPINKGGSVHVKGAHRTESRKLKGLKY